AKFRMVLKGTVTPDRALRITKSDVVSAKIFLFDTSRIVNERVGKRLETLLDGLHRDHTGLFNAHKMADQISRQLAFSIPINGTTGVRCPGGKHALTQDNLPGCIGIGPRTNAACHSGGGPGPRTAPSPSSTRSSRSRWADSPHNRFTRANTGRRPCRR